MKVYITRHGETEWNKEGRMQGWKNSDLTEKGINNAIKLGEALSNIEFDAVYCSPLGRAFDTAKYILGNKNNEIILNDLLKEMNIGDLEGISQREIEEKYPDQYFNFWNKPHLFEPVGGESFKEVVERVRKGFYEIINNTKGENILIVAHTIVIKAIYVIINNYSIEELWKPPFIYDTSLTVLDILDSKIEFVLQADVSHLNG